MPEQKIEVLPVSDVNDFLQEIGEFRQFALEVRNENHNNAPEKAIVVLTLIRDGLVEFLKDNEPFEMIQVRRGIGPVAYMAFVDEGEAISMRTYCGSKGNDLYHAIHEYFGSLDKKILVTQDMLDFLEDTEV